MAETHFLNAVAAYLRGTAGKGDVAEPVQAGDLPAVVVSLDSVQRVGSGLGERTTMVTSGVLHWTATIDLANPVLPEDPKFKLVTQDHPEQLILPQDTLLRANGSEGPLEAADLSVSVGGVPQTVVNALPAAGQVSADAALGVLTFGSPLPTTGSVVAGYFVGRWERRVTEIAGVLRFDVRAADASGVASLSAAVVESLLQAVHPALKGLRKIALTSLSSVGVSDPLRADSRGRTALFSFDYEHEVDRPYSSGGVIRKIGVTAEVSRSLDKKEPAS